MYETPRKDFLPDVQQMKFRFEQKRENGILPCGSEKTVEEIYYGTYFAVAVWKRIYYGDKSRQNNVF